MNVNDVNVEIGGWVVEKLDAVRLKGRKDCFNDGSLDIQDTVRHKSV